MDEDRWKKLDVWKLADDLAYRVYILTRNFPKEEIYGITSQLRRAALSIPTNACLVKQLKMAMYYTYVLQSTKDEGFYTGFTKDLKLRFKQHNDGYVESTKDRGPFNLIYYEACHNRMDAAKREKYLKSYHGKMYLKRRLKSYLTG